MNAAQKINKYVKDWKEKGYPEDIPDEVPERLMKLNLAPSYKAIAIALLRNDLNLEALGFTPKKSPWYSAFKKIEIEKRKADSQKMEVDNG
jgi:predicted phosphoadenosine phosphosulfate sulfurtransferase